MAAGEYRDGGYWYVVPVVIDEDGSMSPGNIPAVPYAHFYGADFGLDPTLVTIRTTKPVDLPQALDISLDDVLAAAGLSEVPFVRIGGQ